MKKNNIENQILVIFGSNGDLAKRKLLPAVFQLYVENLLPERFVVLGAGSQEKDEQAYRNDVREGRFVEKDRNGQVTAKGTYENGKRFED